MNEAIAIKNKVAAIQEDERIEEEQPESLVDWKTIWRPLAIIAAVFLAFFWLPIDSSRFSGAVIESLFVCRRAGGRPAAGTSRFRRPDPFAMD